MLSCLLCLEKRPNQIKMSSKKGNDLNCSSIIAQHFWLKPNAAENSTESICLTCWDNLMTFHQFYQSIAKAHNFFEHEVSSNSIFLEPEVRLEMDQLDQLPRTEVIESSCNDKHESLLMQKRRNHLSHPEPKGNISTKQEMNKTLSYSSDEDSETEIPLSMLRLSTQKTEEVGNCVILDDKTGFSSSTKVDVQTVIENSSDNDLPCDNQCSSDHESEVSNIKCDSDYDTEKDVTIRNKKCTKIYNINISKFFGKLECHKCELSVRAFEDLRQHFQTEHSSEPFVICCGCKFKNSRSLSNHALVHLNPRHLKCSHCDLVLKNSFVLQKHLELNHQCNQCLENFSNKKILQDHQQAIHLMKSDFKCRKCDYKFSTKREQRTHEKSIHGKQTAVICDKCGKHLSSRKSLRQHMLIHSDQPILDPDPVQCDICGKWLKHRNTLRQHKNWVHEKRSEQHCPICNKISTTRRALEMHIRRIHKSKRDFPCTMCEKVLKTERELKEHTNIHTKEKQYTCEICLRNFDRKGSREKHIKIFHSGISRRVQCEICDIWVASSHNLKLHIKKVHERSDVKHPCPICGRASVHEMALKRHIKRNHGSKALISLSNSNPEMQCTLSSTQ